MVGGNCRFNPSINPGQSTGDDWCVSTATSLAFNTHPRLLRRTNRRLLNQNFNANAARQYRPRQSAAARGLLKRLLGRPEAFMEHFDQLKFIIQLHDFLLTQTFTAGWRATS